MSEKAIRRILKQYKTEAKNRNIEFILTDEEAVKLITSACFYCADFSYKNAKVSGIDRQDNSLDYTLENSVSCCTICNFMKGNLDPRSFIDKCKKISEYSHIYPEISKASVMPSNAISVSQYNLNGELVAIYDSLFEAELATNIHSQNIARVCSLGRKKSGGWIWKRTNDGPLTPEELENLVVDDKLKPIEKVSKDGTILQRYISMSDAARQEDIAISSMSTRVSKQRKNKDGSWFRLAVKNV
jgi:hypothetical protein